MENNNAYEEANNWKKEGDYYMSEAQKRAKEGDVKRAMLKAIMAKIYYDNMGEILDKIINEGLNEIKNA